MYLSTGYSDLDLKLEEKKKKEGKAVRYLQRILTLVVVAVIVGATIVCFWRIIMAQDWSQKLLAVSVLVPIWLGVFNMLKWLRSSSEFTELSNKLDKLIETQEKKITQTREIEEQRRNDERELPKIEVLEAKSTASSIELHVKNVGAEGEVTAFVENNSRFKAEWFELNGVVAEKKKKLSRSGEYLVRINRKTVKVANRVANTRPEDYEPHLLKVHFPEAGQIFKCKFSITEGGIEDFEFLGEEDE